MHTWQNAASKECAAGRAVVRATVAAVFFFQTGLRRLTERTSGVFTEYFGFLSSFKWQCYRPKIKLKNTIYDFFFDQDLVVGCFLCLVFLCCLCVLFAPVCNMIQRWLCFDVSFDERTERCYYFLVSKSVLNHFSTLP
jgi:hypothetical protein